MKGEWKRTFDGFGHSVLRLRDVSRLQHGGNVEYAPFVSSIPGDEGKDLMIRLAKVLNAIEADSTLSEEEKDTAIKKTCKDYMQEYVEGK